VRHYRALKPLTYPYDKVERRADPGDVVDQVPKLREAEPWLLRQEAVEVVDDEEGG